MRSPGMLTLSALILLALTTVGCGIFAGNFPVPFAPEYVVPVGTVAEFKNPILRNYPPCTDLVASSSPDGWFVNDSFGFLDAPDWLSINQALREI